MKQCLSLEAELAMLNNSIQEYNASTVLNHIYSTKIILLYFRLTPRNFFDLFYSTQDLMIN